MLTLRNDQLSALLRVPQRVFVAKMTAHLQETARIVDPGRAVDYWSKTQQDQLWMELDLLTRNGFAYEHDIAIAIEYFELFNVDPNESSAVHVITDTQLTAQEKLGILSTLTTPAGRP